MSGPRPTNRVCGDCTACCRILPIVELNKKAHEKCTHQRFGRCSVYEKRPTPCRLWSCQWLREEDTKELGRPDRSHYVIDMVSDYVGVQDANTKEFRKIAAVQVWVDKRFPDAHRDPALRDYLNRRAEKDGMVAIIRFGSDNALVLLAPAFTGTDEWREHVSEMHLREPDAFDKLKHVRTMYEQVDAAAFRKP